MFLISEKFKNEYFLDSSMNIRLNENIIKPQNSGRVRILTKDNKPVLLYYDIIVFCITNSINIDLFLEQKRRVLFNKEVPIWVFQAYHNVKHKEDIINYENEIWTKCCISDFHEVSSNGRIKLFNKELNQSRTADGYNCVSINSKTHRVHRLILESFNPNPNPIFYTMVNHLDENINNNHLDNLEWSNAELNTQYSVDLTPEIVTYIKSKKDLSDTEIQLLVLRLYNFNINRSTLNDIRNNRTWKNIM